MGRSDRRGAGWEAHEYPVSGKPAKTGMEPARGREICPVRRSDRWGAGQGLWVAGIRETCPRPGWNRPGAGRSVRWGALTQGSGVEIHGYPPPGERVESRGSSRSMGAGPGPESTGRGNPGKIPGRAGRGRAGIPRSAKDAGRSGFLGGRGGSEALTVLRFRPSGGGQGKFAPFSRKKGQKRA